MKTEPLWRYIGFPPVEKQRARKNMYTAVECNSEKEPCPNGPIIRSVNPATLETVGDVMETSIAQIPHVLECSRAVQKNWAMVSVKERLRLLHRAARYIREHMEELTFTIASETGKPRIEAINSDIIPPLGVLDFTLGSLKRILRSTRIRMGRMGFMLRLLGRYSYIYPKPIGVVGIISPWNYPFGIPFSQVLMAIAAGNAVILKPSSETPLTALCMREVLDGAGFPKDLLQIVIGLGSGVGVAIVESGVDRIIFTGSTTVGRDIMHRASQRLTPVTLELGGKDPMIILADADIDRAVAAATWGAFINAGQTCVGVKRIYVERSIYAAFLTRLKEQVVHLKQGWGWDDSDVSVGSLINARAVAEMERQVQRALEQGARVLVGGHRHPTLKGNYFEPTVMVDVTQDMDCVRQEIFGPIVVVLPFNTEQDAIRLANDSEFALSGSVWTRNIPRGKNIAEQLESGTIDVNNVAYTYGLGATPWGGKRNSGFGRSHGDFGFHDLIEPHHVHVDKGRLPRDPWWHPYTAGKIRASLALIDIAFFGRSAKIISLLKNLGTKKKSK